MTHAKAASTRRHAIRSRGRSGLHRSGEARCRDAARVRHLSRLPALLQSLRFLPAPVRPDRRQSDDEVAWREIGRFRAKVTEACTLCDMCFMTKCPYVPPHPFQLDFPHLMLRHRVAEAKAGKTDFTARQLAEMDRNGRMAVPLQRPRELGRGQGEQADASADGKGRRIDTTARACRNSHRQTFMRADKAQPGTVNAAAPAFGKRKAALFATCFVNYNKPETGMAARAVLNHLGVETTRRLSRLLRHAVPRTGRDGEGRATRRAKVSAELVQADRRGLRHRDARRRPAG